MPDPGDRFYRAMTDQSRRARDFERRMRWFRWRRTVLEDEVVDLRPHEAQAVRPSAAPVAPRQQC